MMCMVCCQFEFFKGMLLRNVITVGKEIYRKKEEHRNEKLYATFK